MITKLYLLPKNVLILILCLGFSITLSAQVKTTFCEQIKSVKKLIETEHYKPKAFNDSLSKHVHSMFLKALDDDQKFFLQEDIALFNLDKFILDDYIKDKDCSFIENYVAILKKRVNDAKAIITSLRDVTLDYSGKDSLYFNSNRAYNYFEDEKAAKSFWNKRIRYKIITRALDEDSIYANVEENFKTLEIQFKPKVIENQLCLLDEILTQPGGIESFVEEAFLNSLLAYQDPNSSFFNDTDKLLFENALSTNQLSFGINTQKNENGDIIIAFITPGSAAFKNGEFQPNDIILSMMSGNDTLETFCISNEDVIAFKSDSKHNTITFKIKKQNGIVQDIELTKTLIKTSENNIRGYILQGEKTYGYIKIESFYTNIGGSRNSGLANDVARELYKLLKVNIDGLILDLRFNGGGSMKEATELAGMFIDRGPISVLKYNNGETYTVRDPHRGSIYSKPLLVLINNFSASASEYFAAAMQDYNRAILVGSSTHGKASAQIVFPLDEKQDIGYCKLTIEKFYRVTGKSSQSIGVIPDILLPAIQDNFGYSEGDELFALQNDTISTTKKFQTLEKLNLEQTTQKSKNRIQNNDVFQKIVLLNQQLVKHYIKKNEAYPLTIDNIHSDLDRYFNLWEQYYTITDNTTSFFEVKNTKETKDITSYNNEENENNKAVIKNISKDPYIEEAYNILTDFINTNP